MKISFRAIFTCGLYSAICDPVFATSLDYADHLEASLSLGRSEFVRINDDGEHAKTKMNEAEITLLEATDKSIQPGIHGGIYTTLELTILYCQVSS